MPPAAPSASPRRPTPLNNAFKPWRPEMPALLPATFKINLKTVKPNGLAELGVPLGDDTQVKKGKLLEAFEVFGDDDAPLGAPLSVSVLVHAGDKLVADLPLGSLFLPDGSCWYDNRFSVNLALEAFAEVDGVSLMAATDEVRAI
jgi:hypothetical protein